MKASDVIANAAGADQATLWLKQAGFTLDECWEACVERGFKSPRNISRPLKHHEVERAYRTGKLVD